METIGNITHTLRRQSTRPATTNKAFRFGWDKDRMGTALWAMYTALVNISGGTMVRDPELQKSIDMLSQALTQTEDPRKHGLILLGNVGSGKTTAMDSIFKLIPTAVKEGLVERRFRHPWKFDAMDIMRLYDETDRWNDLMDESLIFIDDFGKEPREAVSYGNRTTPMIDLIETRYSKRKDTVLTTNLTAAEIAEKYGPRVADRFRETMTVIPFARDGSFRQR